MTSTDEDRKNVTQVNDNSSEFPTTMIDSLNPAQQNLKSHWDAIYAAVKDEIPSLDSDSSLSDIEDGEIAIFQRHKSKQLTSLPEDLMDLSLDDPVLEEMLESVRYSPVACEEYCTTEPDIRESFGIEISRNNNNTSAEIDTHPESPEQLTGFSTDQNKNLFEVRRENRPQGEECCVQQGNKAGGDPCLSEAQLVTRNREESQRFNASGDGNVDFWQMLSSAWLSRIESPPSTISTASVQTNAASTSDTIQQKATTTENNLAAMNLCEKLANRKSVPHKTAPQIFNAATKERICTSDTKMNVKIDIWNKNASKKQEIQGTSTGQQSKRSPILSLESISQVDLDRILQNLEQMEDKNISVLEDTPNSTPSTSARSYAKSQEKLMEQLTLLAISQSGGMLKELSAKPPCDEQDQPNKEKCKISSSSFHTISPEEGKYSWKKAESLAIRKTSPIVHIDLRNWKLEKTTESQTDNRNRRQRPAWPNSESSSSTEEEENMSPQDQNRVKKKECLASGNDRRWSGCTGKSMLLSQLRKASKEPLKMADSTVSICCAGETGTNLAEEKTLQKKRRKARTETTLVDHKQGNVSVSVVSNTEKGGLGTLNSSSGQQIFERKEIVPLETRLNDTSDASIHTVQQNKPRVLEGEQITQRKGESANKNSTSHKVKPNEQHRREQCRKEQQSRQRLQRHLSNLKPLSSVSGKQLTAESTPLLFSTEASYLPNISTLPPRGRDEMLLLTVHLSSCGQMVPSGQQTGRLLDSALTAANIYNAVVSWVLSLVTVPTCSVNRSYGDCSEAEVVAPFQVVGLQQTWREDGLAFYVCVIPMCEGFVQPIYSRNRKNRVKEELRGTSAFYQLVVKFLSQTSLKPVIWWSEQLNNRLSEQLCPMHVCLPSARLSSVISVSPDTKAVEKVFKVQIGFYWQTVETEENCCPSAEEIGENCKENPEVTMALVFENLFSDPIAFHHVLQLILSNGIDICGLRLLYPTHSLLTDSTGKLPSTYCSDDTKTMPVLALALRGANARVLWMDIVGPFDPGVASVTDRHSINALYCKSRSEPLLYSPRQESRIYWELYVWFGGRVPEDGIVQVGIQNPVRRTRFRSRSNSPQPTGTHTNSRQDRGAQQIIPCRPPATVVATIKADLLLLVSPAVPLNCCGDILSVCTRRGFSLQGVRRLRLTPKRANSLGIGSKQISVFCRTSSNGSLTSQGSAVDELPSHCFLMLLRKENVCHHVPSLLKGLMNELSEQGLIGSVQSRLPHITEFDIGLCFHVVPYTDHILQGLGGSLSAVADSASLTLDVLYKHSYMSNPELEQVVVLTMTGHKTMKEAGIGLRELLRPTVNQSQGQSENNMADGGFELLGLKWLPHLSSSQAKELTPFEVGDRHWQGSIDCLVSSPALVCVLRRVRAFGVLAEILNTTNSKVSLLNAKQSNLEKIMSPTPEIAFRQAALFFTDRELVSDPSARPLLKYIAPSLSSGNTATGKRSQAINKESIFTYMLLGAQPLLTVLVIKPSTLPRHFSKILHKLDLEHFYIVGMKLVSLDKEKASLLSPSNIQQEPDLMSRSVDSLTSSPSAILCVQRENAVKKLLDLLGPEDPHEARALNQFLWRGHCGTDLVHNGFYGSQSYKTAVRDVQMFFPEGLCCEESQMLQNEQILTKTKDLLISPEFTHNRKLVRRSSLAESQAVTVAWSGQQGLCQTTCLLLPGPFFSRSHHPPYIEVMDHLAGSKFLLMGARMGVLDLSQAQHVAKLLTTPDSSSTMVYTHRPGGTQRGCSCSVTIVLIAHKWSLFVSSSGER
eukprot:gi/632952430/ref/XP_007891847.1/ PREDICTED: uncharacterized protein C16orf71 homolog isoform X2 [Callorhinchus milii]